MPHSSHALEGYPNLGDSHALSDLVEGLELKQLEQMMVRTYISNHSNGFGCNNNLHSTSAAMTSSNQDLPAIYIETADGELHLYQANAAI